MNVERLKEKMKEQGISQSELARRIGGNQSAISEYTRGRVQPTDKTIQKIADALGCSFEYLKGNEVIVKELPNYSSAEIYRGDIYFVKMTNRVYDTGVLDAGRPAVVVSNNQGNYHSNYVQVVYLTTKEKKPLPTHVPIICRTPSTAMCEQIQTVSKDRLVEFVRTCTDAEMKQIDEALMISLGLEEKRNGFDFAKLESENAELKVYLKQAQEKNQKLIAEKSELIEKSAVCEDTMRVQIERDMYKKNYEALIDRLLGK